MNRSKPVDIVAWTRAGEKIIIGKGTVTDGFIDAVFYGVVASSGLGKRPDKPESGKRLVISVDDVIDIRLKEIRRGDGREKVRQRIRS